MRWNFLWLLPSLLVGVSSAVAAAATIRPSRDSTSATFELTAPAGESCRIIRALDGRAVCAATPPIPATAPSVHHAPVEHPAGDLYLVIGSFDTRGKADTWARHNDEFAPSIFTLTSHGTRLFRVVIGPLTPDAVPTMRAILAAAAIAGVWTVNACAAGAGADTECLHLDHARSLADVPR